MDGSTFEGKSCMISLEVQKLVDKFLNEMNQFNTNSHVSLIHFGIFDMPNI